MTAKPVALAKPDFDIIQEQVRKVVQRLEWLEGVMNLSFGYGERVDRVKRQVLALNGQISSRYFNQTIAATQEAARVEGADVIPVIVARQILPRGIEQVKVHLCGVEDPVDVLPAGVNGQRIATIPGFDLEVQVRRVPRHAGG